MYTFRFIPIITALLLIYAGVSASFGQDVSKWELPIRSCWDHVEEDPTNNEAASDNDKTIFLPSSSGKILAVDPNSGKTIWTRSTTGAILSNLLVSGNLLYFVVENKRNGSISPPSRSIHAVDIDSGIPSWSRSFRGVQSDLVQVFLVSLRNGLISASTNGELTKYSAQSGEILWETSLGTSLSSAPSHLFNSLLVNTHNKSTIAISDETGKVGQQIVSAAKPTSLAAFSGKLYIGDQLGTINGHFLSDGKSKWRVRTGGRIREIHQSMGRLIVVSDDNYVYSLSLHKGKKLWKRKLSGRIVGSVIIEKHIGVFLSMGSNEALLINLDTGKIVNRIQATDSEYFVSPPIYISGKIVLPTNIGFKAYSPGC